MEEALKKNHGVVLKILAMVDVQGVWLDMILTFVGTTFEFVVARAMRGHCKYLRAPVAYGQWI